MSTNLLSPAFVQRAPTAERIDWTELMARCQSAARLELRGANYAPEDRQDVVSELLARTLEWSRGSAPRADSDRVTLTYLCGVARNLRRELDRWRERAAKHRRETEDLHALSVAALGADTEATPAKHAAIVARSSATAAHAAVSAVLDALDLTEPAPATAEDSPAYLTLLHWVTGWTVDEIAAHRGIGVPLAKKRMAAGNRFLRTFYSAEDLAARLTLGARLGADGTVIYSMADLSREAPHKMADDISENFRRNVCWREGTDAGDRATRPETADEARDACTVLACETRTATDRTTAAHAAETGAALGRLARAHRANAKRSGGRASGAVSDLQGALLTARLT